MVMRDEDCVAFLQWALPQLGMRWPGFRKVRRQVAKRVARRLRALDLEDLLAYRAYLEGHPDEWPVLDAMCRISISRFYRDRGVFDLVRAEVLPRLAATVQTRGGHRIRAWSAGCASGEEPYTLNMVWQLGVQPQFPRVELEIIATDVEPHLLERARCGCYPSSSVKDFPADWLPRAFAPIDGQHSVRQRFRTGIDFQLGDVRREAPPGPFDLILCRHLAFTYLDPLGQQDVLHRLLAELHPTGFLVIGKQEPLPPQADPGLLPFRPHSGIFVREPTGDPPR